MRSPVLVFASVKNSAEKFQWFFVEVVFRENFEELDQEVLISHKGLALKTGAGILLKDGLQMFSVGTLQITQSLKYTQTLDYYQRLKHKQNSDNPEPET